MVEDRPHELETIDQLARSEHLLVWAMRAIALGHEDCPTVIHTFRQVCGVRGEEVLQTYAIFVKYLAMAASRRMEVHVPGCLCVGSDEAMALSIIAAGQRSLCDRYEAGLRSLLGELTDDRVDESLVLTAQGVAGVLEACGLRLPDRRSPADASANEAPLSPAPLLN